MNFMTYEATRGDRYLLHLLKLRDQYTHEHSFRVKTYSRSVAIAIGLSYGEIEIVERTAMLHDIGKILIPGRWANNHIELSKLESGLMRLHPYIGFLMVACSDYMFGDTKQEIASRVSRGILHHHECYDGSGHPIGLKGDRIPIESRIIRACDDYDAHMTRNAITHGEVLSWLKGVLGVRLDPEIVRIIIEKDLFTT